MKRFRSSHLLIVLAALLVVGFYTLELTSNEASVFTLPEFTSTTQIESAGEKPISSLRDFNDAIVNIADQAKQTVVTINVTKTVEAPPDPFSRFFGQPEDGRREFREGSGSGVIVSGEGYVLTNNHVVENADEIELTLYNNRKYDAEIVGTDPMTDIAVLKIDAENLEVIRLGSSDNLRVGEMVLAIGSPMGQNLAHSVSMGIVSAKGRTLQLIGRGGGFEDFIQTDAAINPGNSGGALINMDGDLVGINTAIASRSGGSEGIGFAIPIDLAKKIMTSLIEEGRVTRGFMGIQWGGDVDRTMARALGLDETQGVIVGGVTEGGPADKAGLQEGDVIQSYNGKPLTSWAAFRTDVGTSSPGTEITLGIIREGEEMEMEITLGEMPDELAMDRSPDRDQSMDKRLGFQVRDLDPQLARQLDLEPNQKGVVVVNVSRGSNAQRQGLQKGDVITEADRRPVEDSSDLKAIINDIAGQDDNVVLLKVIRGGNNHFIAFEL